MAATMADTDCVGDKISWQGAQGNLTSRCLCDTSATCTQIADAGLARYRYDHQQALGLDLQLAVGDMSPSAGSALGGAAVTLTGTGFATRAGGLNLSTP